VHAWAAQDVIRLSFNRIGPCRERSISVRAPEPDRAYRARAAGRFALPLRPRREKPGGDTRTVFPWARFRRDDQIEGHPEQFHRVRRTSFLPKEKAVWWPRWGAGEFLPNRHRLSADSSSSVCIHA
jgi:hypothetical protein